MIKLIMSALTNLAATRSIMVDKKLRYWLQCDDVVISPSIRYLLSAGLSNMNTEVFIALLGNKNTQRCFKHRSLTRRHVEPCASSREFLKPLYFTMINNKMIISHVVEFGRATSKKQLVRSIYL